MKTILTPITFLLFSFHFFGQNITQIEKLEAKIDKLTKIVEGDNDTTFSVGELFLKHTNIPYYNKDNELISDGFNIKEVRVEIKNGVIIDVNIYTDDGKYFTNRNAPISFNRINNKKDALYYEINNDIYKIYMNSIFLYKPKRNFLPKDGIFILTDIDSSKVLYKSAGINSLLNVKIYSDILGLIDKESNGLAQTEVFFSIPIHRKNIPNSSIYLFNNFSMKVQLSRLDKKYQTTSVSIIDSSFSRITFNQRKWLNIELQLSLINGHIEKKTANTFSLDFITGLNISNFGDYSDTTNYTLPFIGLNPTINLQSSRNFGVNLSSKIFVEYFPMKQSEKYGNKRIYFAPQIELFFNPYGKIGSKIFSRISYTTLTQTRGDYWSFQFGYNLSFSELINNKLDD